jgi:hypothetical protein
MGKVTQICQISKKENFKATNFYNKFQWVSKNIEGIWAFFTFIFSMKPNLARALLWMIAT